MKRGFDERFLTLPDERPPPLAVPPGLSFVPWRRSGRLLFLAGHGPNLRTAPPQFDYVGKVGKDLSEQVAIQAARLVGLNLLVTARGALGSLDDVAGVVEMVGAVNSAQGFVHQPQVINGCSSLMIEVFGEAGRHARMAFGAAELPFDMAVEIKMTLELHEAPR